ncbi:MAG: aspartate kinase [Firmicutes bacterium]|nr:aspartate kinase [Bacillota bacterium]
MKIIVQKFGGSSVATPQQREKVVGHVIGAVKEGLAVVVVVSAMGRAGDPYATDTLINLVRRPDGGVSQRDLDLLMSCGEVISTVILAQTLQNLGYPAVALTGAQAGIITDDHFGDARIKEIKPDNILANLESGRIVIVAGFQGVTPEGEVTTLGRGGSDTTAAALGVALHAEVVEVYTDVEGVMTADPRIVSEARTLTQVTYREVSEMALLGAKVIHPRAVEIAMEDRVPLKVKCTFSDAPGTLIWDSPSGGIEIRGDRTITGIAHIAGVAQVKVRSEENFNTGGQSLKVFRSLAEAAISLDLIEVTPELITFTMPEERLEQAVKILTGLGFKVESAPGFAKVSAVGAGMHGVPGVMARIVEALVRAEVPIFQTTDSHTTISCLVRRQDMERAVQALHRQFT